MQDTAGRQGDELYSNNSYQLYQKNNFVGDIDNYIQTVETDVEVQNYIKQFIEFRNNEFKHKLTDSDIRFMLEKLKKHSRGIKENKILLIRTAMFNKWKDIFPLKEIEQREQNKKQVHVYKCDPPPLQDGEEIDF